MSHIHHPITKYEKSLGLAASGGEIPFVNVDLSFRMMSVQQQETLEVFLLAQGWLEPAESS